MTYRNDFIVSTNDDSLHDTMNGTVTGKLIRCRDCKHNRTAKCPMYIEHYEAGYGYSVDVRNEPDDFCSLAEPALSQPETGQI